MKRNTMKSTSVKAILGSICTAFSALAVVVMVIVPGQALAAGDPSKCIEIIGEEGNYSYGDTVRGNLKEVYAAGAFWGGNPSRTYDSLDSKMTGAITKLKQRKYDDARIKVSDFIGVVEYYSTIAPPKTKLDPDAAYILLNGSGSTSSNPIDVGAYGARDCIDDLLNP